MEMRKCKECGKMFMPKGRERYCSDTHYRPCPICGEPVVAKYLSDPPRKCNNCRSKKTSIKPKKLFEIPEEANFAPEKPKKAKINFNELIVEQPKGLSQAVFCETMKGVVRTYIGNELKDGLIPGHEYLINVDHNEYTYEVSVTEDVTAGDPVNIYRPCSSQISFFSQFAKRKEA